MNKKIIVLFITFCLLVCSCPVAFAENKIKAGNIDFQVVSDIHFQSAERLGDLSLSQNFDENNIFYNATVQGQMSDISEAITREYFDEFLNSDKEILIIPGDLTGGNKTDHRLLARIMQNVLDKAREQGKTKKIYVINGNHDIASDNSEKFCSKEDFISCYNNFGYSDAVCVDENSCSYTADLNDDYRLIAVDSCIYGADNGKISDGRLDWIKEQTENCKNDGKVPVVMMHHSLLTHFALQSMIDGYMSVAKKFISFGIKYVFTGHMHGNDIAEAEYNGSKIYDIETGSLITSPCSYRNVSISSDVCNVKTEYITRVDENSLPLGLTDAQKDLILNDFVSYGNRFFEKGVSNWINKYIGSAQVVGRKLKIDGNSLLYKVIDVILGYVGDTINMPLYNSENASGRFDSFEELVNACGYKLPDSEYEYPYEPIAKIVTSFFGGDENIKYSSSEVQITVCVLATGITAAVSDILSFGKTTFKDKIFDYAEKNSTLIKSKTDSVMVFVSALLTPVVEGISDDLYSPADLNVRLDGVDVYTKSVSPVPLTFFGLVLNYLKSFIKAL